MPVIQSVPYETAEDVLQLARVITNDASGAAGIAGSILADSQPGTIPLIADRYRFLQDRLIAGGVETFNKYGVVYGLTPVSNVANPRTNVTLSYTGYFDGQNNYSTPALPADLIKPLELWESQSTDNLWVPMIQAPDSIATRPFQMRFSIWDYEQDTLILPGATTTNDLKIKYLCYAPDITEPSSPIYIVRCKTALAYLVAEQAASLRGGVQMAQMFNQKAEVAIQMIIDRTARKEAYAHFARLPFRARRNRGQY